MALLAGLEPPHSSRLSSVIVGAPPLGALALLGSKSSALVIEYVSIYILLVLESLSVAVEPKQIASAKILRS